MMNLRPCYLRLMNFLQRLWRYLIGIMLGCVIVYMMFPDRDWLAWTPSKTLIRQVNTFPLQLTDSMATQLRTDRALPPRVLHARTFGKPDFSRSDTRTDPKRYLISDGDLLLTVTIERDTLITLVGID